MCYEPKSLKLGDYGIDSPKSKIYFSGHDEDNQRMCDVFGCGKKLTLQESLAGTKCINHINQIKVDATRFIQYPTKSNCAVRPKRIRVSKHSKGE